MIHYTNIRRIFFCMCGQWREFLAVGSHWRRSVYSTLEPGQRLWLFFFSHAELWCLGVWAVTARRDCRQGVVSLRSAFQILAVSRVSCWYPHSFLPSYLPSQASQPCFSVFICGPRQVTSLTPQLQQPGEHVDAHQPCSNLSRGVERQPMGSPLPQVVPRLFWCRSSRNIS